MNISSDIFSTDGSNSSDHLFFNGTGDEISFDTFSNVYFITFLLGVPINSYVIWLIVTGTGNGLAAEFFTLNLTVCEILICIQLLLIILRYKFIILWTAVLFLDGLATTGRPLFQCLMCVERYLAVLHPVTFLKFKPLRYRVICCVFIWPICLGSSLFSLFSYHARNIFIFTILFRFLLYLSIQVFCLVAVLRALKQSGPGERGRERKEENHMKRRAFYLILITTVTMVLALVGEEMNISSEIFPTDGSNFSDYFIYNGTEDEMGFSMTSLADIVILLLGFPINSYVIWLIVTGTGNGLAAEFFSLNLSITFVFFDCTQ
ncbi:chemokine XC receptor 1-like [Pseudorasbora parva]|uniref:chemokine XC receptor 1-like n=1 Tax=Pseudorasbora parva TaxID=51549 RepID=UPI00351F0722